MLASDVAATCRLAGVGGQAVGFLTAYRPPDRPHTLFVWQVGVLAEARGNRLAARMIGDVLDQETPRGVSTLEATVSPDNPSSRAIFHHLAAERGAPTHSEPRFPADCFPVAGHEDEDRLVIGPFDRTRRPDARKEEGPWRRSNPQTPRSRLNVTNPRCGATAALAGGLRRGERRRNL